MVVHSLHHKKWINFNQIGIGLGTKQEVLYHHVRYCRDTCLQLPKSSELFRLRKNYKKFALTVYSENFKIYISKLQCSAEVTWEDFDAAVRSIKTIV